MDPQIEHLIVVLVIMAVIGGFVVAAYYFIMSTPAGKGLGKFLGGVGAVLGSIGAQLENCSKVGYLNVGKGCWAGVLAIGVAVLWGGYKLLNSSGLAKLFGSKSPDPRVGKIEAETGKTQGEIADEINNEINYESLPSDASPEVMEASMTKAINRAIRNIFNRTFRKIRNTPEQIKELNEIEMKSYTTYEEDANDNLDSEQEKESDEAAEDAVPEVEPPIPEFAV